MPLKHATETRLIVFLGVTIVGVDCAIRLLPPLPEGAFLWGSLGVLLFLYPLLLFPLFRARRADYAFRFLHFLPLLLLFLSKYGLIPLLGSFLLLFLYCFRVIRQRVSRSIVLSGLFLLLVAFSAYDRWGISVLSSLRGQWNSFHSMVADEEVPSVNTDPSSSLGEEVWRMRLRRMHRRQDRLVQEDGLVDRPSLPPKEVPLLGGESSSSTPPKLVSSGADVRLVLLLFLAGYTGILHARARRRV